MRCRMAKLTRIFPIVLAVVLCAIFMFGCADTAEQSEKKPDDTPKYTVTFMVDGEVYKTVEVYRGDTLPDIKKPEKKSTSKKSYTFSAWFKDDEFLERYDTNAVITGDLTLYAKFNENPVITAGTGAIDAVVGFLIVIAVLALLVGIFYLSGIIFRTKAMSKEKLFEFKKREASREPAYVPEIIDEGDELETVAAITAAITVMLTEENGGESPEFVIRRVTRKK